MGPQFRRHLWADAEPARKTGDRLMEQHAEPVDGSISPGARGGEKSGFERAIDEIGDNGVGWQ